MKKINLIWQTDYEPEKASEYDWLCFLLSEFQIMHIRDGKNKVCLDNSVIVTQGLSKSNVSMSDYICRFKHKGIKVGCIHISDEYLSTPINFYKEAAFVFRNYYRRDTNMLKNSHFFALGYRADFCKSLPKKKISDRK